MPEAAIAHWGGVTKHADDARRARARARRLARAYPPPDGPWQQGRSPGVPGVPSRGDQRRRGASCAQPAFKAKVTAEEKVEGDQRRGQCGGRAPGRVPGTRSRGRGWRGGPGRAAGKMTHQRASSRASPNRTFLLRRAPPLLGDTVALARRQGSRGKAARLEELAIAPATRGARRHTPSKQDRAFTTKLHEVLAMPGRRDRRAPRGRPRIRSKDKARFWGRKPMISSSRRRFLAAAARARRRGVRRDGRAGGDAPGLLSAS